MTTSSSSMRPALRPRTLVVPLLLIALPGAWIVLASEGEGESKATGARSAVVVPIHDEINDITLTSLQRRVEQVRAQGADMIVLELDTPGGLASSALEICTFLKNVSDLKTVAWVRPAAYSAGSMIALACDEIVMASASKMGDCAPIIISPTEGLQELGKTERAKAESPILKEFRDSALRNHYDVLLCESMVRLGNEIWWMENGEGGERRFVLKALKEELVKDESANWRPVEMMTDAVTGREVAVHQPVVGENDLLTLTQSEAVAFGFARAIVSNEEELTKHYGLAGALSRMETNWAEGVADFLSSPIVRTILMMLIVLGFYAEFQAPGHFVGGSVAVVALLIFLGAPYLTGLADAWEILLIVLGVVLLGVEVFVLPGFGVAGFVGVLLMLVGFIATFVPSEPGPLWVPRMPATWLGLKTGLKVVFGGLGLSLIGVWLLNRYLPRIPGARGLLLAPAAPAFVGVDAFDGPAPVEPSAPVQLGDAGRAVTMLRPAGKAQINGRRVDVIAQGTTIEPGATVEVVEVTGNRVVVREIRKA